MERQRFSAERMARDYLALYRKLLGTGTGREDWANGEKKIGRTGRPPIPLHDDIARPRGNGKQRAQMGGEW